jgi:hypothetical protein
MKIERLGVACRVGAWVGVVEEQRINWVWTCEFECCGRL